jgi:hypothetical protein
MKVILISEKHGRSRSVELGRWSRALLSLCCLGLPLGMVASGYFAGQDSEARSLRGASLDTLQDELDKQSGEFDDLQGLAERQLQAMTLNLAELQARMTRLDALGQHLTAMADLEEGEFDFSQAPALGGPMAGEFNVDFTSMDLGDELSRVLGRPQHPPHPALLLLLGVGARRPNSYNLVGAVVAAPQNTTQFVTEIH